LKDNKNDRVKNIHSDLIDRCIQNDKIAQMKMYDLYHRAVYGSIIRLIKNPVETEDLMQETFLNAFTNIDSYRAEASFGTWIKKIAVNGALNTLRKKSLDFSDTPEENLPEKESSSDENYSRFTMDEIMGEINRLSEGYRIVLNLYLLEGFDHDEIGEILKIKPVTSRTQYLRAKKKLAQNLTDSYYARQA